MYGCRICIDSLIQSLEFYKSLDFCNLSLLPNLYVLDSSKSLNVYKILEHCNLRLRRIQDFLHWNQLNFNSNTKKSSDRALNHTRALVIMVSPQSRGHCKKGQMHFYCQDHVTPQQCYTVGVIELELIGHGCYTESNIYIFGTIF